MRKQRNSPLSVYQNILVHPWWFGRGMLLFTVQRVRVRITGAWCLRRGRAGTDASGCGRSSDPRSTRRLRGASFQRHKTRTHCTLHSPLSTHALRFSRSTYVPNARRTFELFAAPALAYKYEARWRGLATTATHCESTSAYIEDAAGVLPVDFITYLSIVDN